MDQLQHQDHDVEGTLEVEPDYDWDPYQGALKGTDALLYEHEECDPISPIALDLQAWEDDASIVDPEDDLGSGPF